MFNTCHGSLRPEWNSRIIHEFGAVGIRSFTQEIRPEALKDVVLNFYELLRNPEMQTLPIDKVWRQAVEKAIQGADQQGLRDEIKKLFDTITQISEVTFPGEERAPAAG